MDIERVRLYVEIGIGGVLAAILLLLLYLFINKRTAVKFALSQLHRFTNKKELEIELYKKMNLIYSFAQNAVYIGLLGTVIGIVITLQNVDLAKRSQMIASLSIPLLSTAASIVVAVVGNFIYNSLEEYVEQVLREWDVKNGG